MKQINLNKEQRSAYKKIRDYDVTFLYGRSGTGKTMTAVYTALRMLNEGEVSRIIISRPAVPAENLGFLPGDLDTKYSVYMTPIMDFVNEFDVGKTYDKLVKDGKITPSPIAFMRGMNFEDSFILVDEVQNLTELQLKLILTRLPRKGKIVLCGDCEQSDTYDLSAFDKLVSIADHEACRKFMYAFEFNTIERNPNIENILEAW